MMKPVFVLLLLAAPFTFAQPETNQVFVRTGAIGGAIAGGFQMSDAPVEGAPYSATITNESIQTLADGNRIVETSTGTMARDSMGRTRQDAPLPTIGNLTPADAPHLVFLRDPVAQVSYTLNLTDKTAMKGPGFFAKETVRAGGATTVSVRAMAPASSVADIALPAPVLGPPGPVITFQKSALATEGEQRQNEDLGSQTMEGVLVNGVRTTRTIQAGQIGNDRPINIVTEVWTSPELKTVIYSKRSDPRMGEQTFKLTNIVRAEPDASLFTVPADFKVVEGPEPIMYRDKAVAPPAQ